MYIMIHMLVTIRQQLGSLLHNTFYSRGSLAYHFIGQHNETVPPIWHVLLLKVNNKQNVI